MNAHLRNREYHLMQISHALFVAKEGFQRCDDLEGDKKVIKALVIEMGRALRGLVDTCTDDYATSNSISYLEGIEATINDDVDNQFQDAMDARDDAMSDRPVSHRPPAGIVYDHARGM